MAATEYTYAIDVDTANGKVNLDALTREIAASSIVVALDHLDTSGNTLSVWMKDALTAGDKTTLDGVVAAHEGAATEAGMIIEGDRFVATVNTTTDHATTFAEFRYVSGASIKVADRYPGDKVNFEVWHPAGTEPLAVYGNNIPIPADGVVEWGTIASEEEGRADIPAGIELRVVYTSVAPSGTAPEVCIFYRTHQG
jgi:hypothetical protein